jgi:hypothetical protein
VQVGDVLRTVPMTQGEGRLQVPAGELLIVDPHSRLLRELPHVDAFQQWMKQQSEQRRGKTATK